MHPLTPHSASHASLRDLLLHPLLPHSRAALVILLLDLWELVEHLSRRDVVGRGHGAPAACMGEGGEGSWTNGVGVGGGGERRTERRKRPREAQPGRGKDTRTAPLAMPGANLAVAWLRLRIPNRPECGARGASLPHQR
eukprot:scaffold174_cov99-Isochrysis_galbana.AAC.4